MPKMTTKDLTTLITKLKEENSALKKRTAGKPPKKLKGATRTERYRIRVKEERKRKAAMTPAERQAQRQARRQAQRSAEKKLLTTMKKIPELEKALTLPTTHKSNIRSNAKITKAVHAQVHAQKVKDASNLLKGELRKKAFNLGSGAIRTLGKVSAPALAVEAAGFAANQYIQNEKSKKLAEINKETNRININRTSVESKRRQNLGSISADKRASRAASKRKRQTLIKPWNN